MFMRAGKGSIAFAHPRYSRWFARSVKRSRKRGFPPPLGGAVLVAEVEGLGFPIGAGLPRPSAGRVVLHDGNRPKLSVLLRFESEADSARFVEAWPSVQRELVEHWELAVLGYTALVARIEAKPVEGGVLMTVNAEPKEVERLSRFLATTIKNRTRRPRAPKSR